MIPNFEFHDCQELLDGIEIEDGQHTLREGDLGFQELGSQLITADMGVKGLDSMLEQLLLKSVSEIEDDLVSVGFNGEGEEINLEIDVVLSQILKGKSELSAQNEDLDGLVGSQELLVGLHELDDVIVGEDDLTSAELVLSLVHNQYRNEIDKVPERMVRILDHPITKACDVLCEGWFTLQNNVLQTHPFLQAVQLC